MTSTPITQQQQQKKHTCLDSFRVYVNIEPNANERSSPSKHVLFSLFVSIFRSSLFIQPWKISACSSCVCLSTRTCLTSSLSLLPSNCLSRLCLSSSLSPLDFLSLSLVVTSLVCGCESNFLVREYFPLFSCSLVRCNFLKMAAKIAETSK
jgi:hypothetical protein